VPAGRPGPLDKAARLWIDNPRWRSVPFYLRTGKRLAASQQRVSLILREPAGPLAGKLASNSNVLSFSLAGDGQIDLSLVAKKPGPDGQPDQVPARHSRLAELP
jgi:glucose-6-phosphate 1-dehydrogenase